MDRRVWLLVEWVDENNAFPTYGVINVNTFSFKENDLQVGKQTLISLKHNEPRSAKIIRISDNKRQVIEHKDFLERQDTQVKNVLQLCMRTIKEMKSEQYTTSMESSSLQTNISGQQSSMPRVITANIDNSDSDTDTEFLQKNHQLQMANYARQTRRRNVRYETNTYHKTNQNPTTSQRRRSIVSSTPLPGKVIPDSITLCFDQGTQTDNTWVHPQTDKIEEIELVLKHLYGRFQSLVMRVNGGINGTMETSEYEQNGEVSYAEQNNSYAAPDNVAENDGMANCIEDNNVTMGDIGAESAVDPETLNMDVKVTVKMETGRKTPNENTRVRRMSAQTTYSNEMVAIGNGHAMVPARLLNEIDWTSHTTATRQLLQAIFSRKVLATHSLTGKQSPAHLNKPAKKLLDPNMVEDIVTTVSTKSAVPKNLVRNTITVKCTDEAKLYRNRQRYKFSRSEKRTQNDENLPPSLTHSSEDSSNVVT